jgi:hypothetical protein
MALQKKNDRELALEKLQLEKKRHPVNSSPLVHLNLSPLFQKPALFNFFEHAVVEDTGLLPVALQAVEKASLMTIAKPCLRSVAARLNPLNERSVEDGFRFQGQKLGIRAS